MSQALALEARNIFKWFPGGFANDMVDFDLRRGEIHALLGENGAGKSTLMNIIYGLYAPDGGEIYVGGQEVKIDNPRDALSQGIGMVHQDFMLIPVFTVLENIILGVEDQRGVSLDMTRGRQRLKELSQKYGLDVDPDAITGQLPVGVQQRVEILKALYRQARILVLDEPTSVLTPQETLSLFAVLRNLSEDGLSIIFITHKLNEVMQIADRITIMRAGKVVGSTTPQETNERDLARMMVGRPVSFEVEKSANPAGETILSVSDLSIVDERGLQVVDRVSFDVRAGEVLGLAGVLGNGQSQLVEALAGLRVTQGGSIVFLGKDTARLSPRQLAELGMAYIPEDRLGEGLVLPYSVSDNLALKSYFKKPFASGFVLQQNAFDSNFDHQVSTFGIKAIDIKSPVRYLSGGNQQKVVLAREISKPIRLLIAAQPTRGLDVGTIELVHRYLIAKRDAGCAILLMSTDLDEVMALSDRIAVMYRGSIVGELPATQTSKEDLGMMMSGAVIAESASNRTPS